MSEYVDHFVYPNEQNGYHVSVHSNNMRVIVLEVIVPDDVPAQAVIVAVNSALQKDSSLKLIGLEYNTKVLTNHRIKGE